MNAFLQHFNNPAAAERYAEGPPRFMPGFADMQRMCGVLLAEYAGDKAEILVLGAGGGLELKAFAEMQPGWRFVGVDPAGEMLKLARATMGPLAERAQFVEGYIEDAPPGPFDGAACLLTLHFLEAEERLATLRGIRGRLTPGAPFVAAHSSFPQEAERRAAWLRRYAAFAVASGADPAQADQARQAVSDMLAMTSPETDVELMREAGFRDIEMFYAAFTWRGWIARA